MKTPARPPSPRRAAQNAADVPAILDFMRALWAIAHGLERASKRMQQDVGVTGPQRLALRILGLRPGVSAGELAEALHIHPSTLTGILKRLQAQGLVTRVTDKTDQRRAVLQLTSDGARVNARKSGTVEAAVGAALRRVSGRRRTTARDVLLELANQLERSASSPRRRV